MKWPRLILPLGSALLLAGFVFVRLVNVVQAPPVAACNTTTIYLSSATTTVGTWVNNTGCTLFTIEAIGAGGGGGGGQTGSVAGCGGGGGGYSKITGLTIAALASVA